MSVISNEQSSEISSKQSSLKFVPPSKARDNNITLTKEQVSYLAGFLEGEGCFTTYKRRVIEGYSLHPKIIFESTDFDVAKKIATWFEVNPVPLKKRQSHHKQSWLVVKTGSGARKLMELIRPLMGSRRGAKIDEVLAATQMS